MKRKLSQAIDRCVASMAAFCLAGGDTKPMLRDLLSAVRIAQGGTFRDATGHENFQFEYIRWVGEQALARLMHRVETRLGTVVDDADRALVREEIADAFGAAISGFEAALSGRGRGGHPTAD